MEATPDIPKTETETPDTTKTETETPDIPAETTETMNFESLQACVMDGSVKSLTPYKELLSSLPKNNLSTLLYYAIKNRSTDIAEVLVDEYAANVSPALFEDLCVRMGAHAGIRSFFYKYFMALDTKTAVEFITPTVLANFSGYPIDLRIALYKHARCMPKHAPQVCDMLKMAKAGLYFSGMELVTKECLSLKGHLKMSLTEFAALQKSAAEKDMEIASLKQKLSEKDNDLEMYANKFSTFESELAILYTQVENKVSRTELDNVPELEAQALELEEQILTSCSERGLDTDIMKEDLRTLRSVSIASASTELKTKVADLEAQILAMKGVSTEQEVKILEMTGDLKMWLSGKYVAQETVGCIAQLQEDVSRKDKVIDLVCADIDRLAAQCTELEARANDISALNRELDDFRSGRTLAKVNADTLRALHGQLVSLETRIGAKDLAIKKVLEIVSQA